MRLKVLEEKLAKVEGSPTEVEQAKVQVRRMLDRIAVIKPPHVTRPVPATRPMHKTCW